MKSNLTEETLLECGLTELEAKVYTTLLENGGSTVLTLAKRGSLKRTNLYNILQSLQEKNLVRREEKEGKTLFYPETPNNLKDLLNLRENTMYVAKQTLELLMPSLTSKHNLLASKPVITYLEGLIGLQKLYQDILDTGKDILLIRSTFDSKRSDVNRIVMKQIVEQVKRGIHARVVGPNEADAKEVYTKYDKYRLVTQRLITNFPFNLPAQVLIYGNKTALSTIRDNIMITIIDNKDISDTFRGIFEFIWTYCEKEHNELVKNWKVE